MFESGSAIVSFGPGLSREARDDICDLLQEADRAASTLHDRDQVWKSWVDFHRNVLKKHCCEQRAVITTPTLFISDIEELHAITLNARGYEDPERLFGLGQQVLETLGIHPFAEAFFKTGQQGGRLLSWQAVPCEINRHGEIILTSFGVSLSTRMGHRAGGSAGPLDREIVIRINGGAYMFDAHAYAAFYRDEVRAGLQNRALCSLVRQEL